MREELKALVRYRIEQAEEALDAAAILLDGEKTRSSVNRAYYSMFYSVLALMAAEGLEAHRHSGVISQFDRRFVRDGPFGVEYSRWLHEAFDLRNRADYRELFAVSKDRATGILEHARGFTAAVRKEVRRLFEQG